MTTVNVPQAIPLKGVPDVELVAIGAWNASTGPVTITDDDLKAALAALGCPGVHKPVLKLGHEEPDPGADRMRWDGTPAVGWVSNMRLSANKAKLLGDYTGVPAWLVDVMPSAYPQRSVEIQRQFRCQVGHTHPFVITAVSLLGIYPPAVGVIRSLNDVQALYTLAAATDTPAPEVTGSIAVRLAGQDDADTRRTVTEIERASRADFDRDRDEWEESIDDLLRAYGIVQRRQREQLTAQIAPLVDAGRFDDLAELVVDARTAADTIYTEMFTAASLAIGLQIAEAADQGITGLTAVPDELYLRSVADGIAATMASTLAATAGRDAAQLAAPGVSGVSVADTVETKLSDLSDRFLRDQFGGAIGAARASGRYEVLSVAPNGAYYASEVNDRNTCDRCREIDGRRFDDLTEAMSAYGAGGYQQCSGGGRCRGRLVAVWGATPRLSAIPLRVGNRVMLASIELHLPGKHDQSNHGRKGKGKKSAKPASSGSDDDGKPDLGTPLTAAQYAALDPASNDRWLAEDELGNTAAGRDVMEFALTHINSFTGAAWNHDDTWTIAKGGEVKDAKRAARAKAFIEATRQTPKEIIPPVLHRGMVIDDEDFDDFQKSHAVGSKVEIGASSFSSSRETARTYADDTFVDEGIGVLIEFDTSDGAQALPIDVLNRKATFREFVALGQFEVTSFEKAGSGKVKWVVKMKQTGMF